MTVLLGALVLWACQSPTDPDDVPDLIEATVSPDPAPAAGPTGRFYKVEGDDNTPDESREYDWKATFSIAVRLTEDAASKDVSLDLPLRVTAATVKVQQASGGIVTPPTGGEAERYEFVITQSDSNRFVAVNTTINMTFDVWYDLPNLRKEALVSVTLSFADDSGATFSEIVEATVAP
jgi:hypothetical protein